MQVVQERTLNGQMVRTGFETGLSYHKLEESVEGETVLQKWHLEPKARRSWARSDIPGMGLGMLTMNRLREEVQMDS